MRPIRPRQPGDTHKQGKPTGRPANPRRAAREGTPPRARDADATMPLLTTTLWEFPSQHYVGPDGSRMQGDKRYVGASPSWVIWQLLQRYTKPGDTVLDPMVGSGTTIDVCHDTGRKAIGFDLAPSRDDIRQGDARKINLPNASADFVFIDPPYSTHVDYSDNPACIGKLDALGDDRGRAYFQSMRQVIREIARVLKPGSHMGLYVSDSFRKGRGFSPIGFELFAMMREVLEPVDIIAVVRHNQKLDRGNWHKAAEEGNFFLRGFNYLFIMQKPVQR